MSNLAYEIEDLKAKVLYHCSRIRAELVSLEYIISELDRIAALVSPEKP